MPNQWEQCGKQKYNCDKCGQFRWEYPSQITGEHVFCSRQCQNVWLANNTNLPNTEECDQCGVEFKRKPSHVKEHTFCTQKCYAKWETKENPKSFYKTRRWHRKREEIRERDNHTCQDCEEQKDWLEVHHIIPLSEGGPPLDDDNLITLCKSCHIDRHRKSA